MGISTFWHLLLASDRPSYPRWWHRKHRKQNIFDKGQRYQDHIEIHNMGHQAMREPIRFPNHLQCLLWWLVAYTKSGKHKKVPQPPEKKTLHYQNHGFLDPFKNHARFFQNFSFTHYLQYASIYPFIHLSLSPPALI